MLITDRFFEALALCNTFIDLIMAIHPIELMAIQKAVSSRNDGNENQ
jgi:hypothetical protein